MPRAILHSHTRTQLTQFAAQPAHAVMLVGSNGIGKTYLAERLVEGLLQLEPQTLASHPYFTLVRPEKGTISIDAIRELQRFLQLKTLGKQPLRRAVILEHAEGLTIEAQNAFLKLLEEPPADTVLVLTADNQRALLPTILSRLQTIPVNAPDESLLKAHFTEQGKAAETITQAYFLSGGLPGLMSALLSDDQTHPLLGGVATAKDVLQKQLFERLTLVEPLSKQKEEALYMLQALQHIAQTGLNQGAVKGDAAKIKQWHHILASATTAHDALRQNSNTKLVLTDLFLHL